MKMTRGDLKKLIAEEIETIHVDEGVVDWAKSFFVSEEKMGEYAKRLAYYVKKVNEFYENPELGPEGEYDTWDPEKGEGEDRSGAIDVGGFVTRQYQRANMERDPEYDKEWTEFERLRNEANQALKALDYKSVQGFWSKPKKNAYLDKGFAAATAALSIAFKANKAYYKIEHAARVDASEAARSRVEKRGEGRRQWYKQSKATAVADAERNKRQAAELARNRGPDWGKTWRQRSAPWLESTDREELKRIIAEELKSVLSGK